MSLIKLYFNKSVRATSSIPDNDNYIFEHEGRTSDYYALGELEYITVDYDLSPAVTTSETIEQMCFDHGEHVLIYKGYSLEEAKKAAYMYDLLE